MDVPDDLERSWKTICPFGWEHADGGIGKNFRVYPSNSAYCFELHGSLTPVRVIMMSRGCGAHRAAMYLDSKYALTVPKEVYWEKMKRLVLERETREVSVGNAQNAVEAMHTALHRLPGYADVSLDEEMLGTIEERLEELDRVLRARDGSVRVWLAETVDVVRERLEP